MPRSYTLGKREAAVQETRERIIAAAREAILNGGLARASLVDVARRADVTRATVYYQFGSRLGLLEAVLTDALERAGLARLIELLDWPDAREAIEESIRAATRMWAAEHALFRTLFGLAAIDPEARDVVEKRAAEHRSGIAYLTARLAGQRALRDGVSGEHARIVLTTVTSFATFDALAAAGAQPVETISDTLIELAGTVLRQETGGRTTP